MTELSQENLLKAGQKKMDWSQSVMPLLSGLQKEFAETQPFKGVTIGVSLHIEQKTSILLKTLQIGGAKIVATGNFGTTNDDIAAALNDMGIKVYGKRNDPREAHLENVRNVLRHKPDMLLDNGADLTWYSVREDEFSIKDIIGGTEETTSGGFRMREQMEGEVPFPMIVINDSPLKYIVENKHGVGQSVAESFNRITNLMPQGKKVVIWGYGWCGRGAAKYFRALGSQVAVVEKDAIVALEAISDGYTVLTEEEAAKWANVIVTATGREDVVHADLFKLMKNDVILANAGHFDFEINVPALKKQAISVAPQDDGIDRYTMPDGKTIVLLCDGRMFNLGGREPKGNTMECMDMGFALQAMSLDCVVNKKTELVPGAQPVPDYINYELARRMTAALQD